MLLEVKNIDKRYGKQGILSDVSFYLKEGDCLGLTGRNGSGKTTLVKIITGLIAKDRGLVLVKGEPNADLYRRKIGMSLAESYFDINLSCRQIIKQVSMIKTIDRYELQEYLEELNLLAQYHVPYKKLSHGNKKKVAIISALVGGNELFIFDEPTDGLDSRSSAYFNALIGKLKVSGAGIILISHRAEEIREHCNVSYHLS